MYAYYLNLLILILDEIDPYRERLFRDGFNAVCNHISGGRKLVPQLGLTQPVQLEITLDVYGDELDRLARAYKLKAEDGLNDAMETAALRDVVSRHYHALVTSGEEGAGLRDGQAKKKTFDLLLKNLNNRRKVNTEHFKEHHSNLTDWPESLKVVAEAGGLLLDVPSEYISFDDRVDAGTTMLALMREVRSIASIHSLSQVDSMLQRIHMEMGQLYWSNDEPNDFPMALQHFKESLAINRRLAVVGGNHLLVDALEAVALASSALGQFIAAHEAFDECIDATSDISNVLDRQYMQARVLTNYGVSMYQYAMSYQFSDDGEVNGNSGKHTNNAKDKIKVISSAEEKLRKAVHLFSKLNVNASDLFLVKANEYLSNISYLRQ
jgi:tetratricopeptide (TPR) repeat protein